MELGAGPSLISKYKHQVQCSHSSFSAPTCPLFPWSPPCRAAPESPEKLDLPGSEALGSTQQAEKGQGRVKGIPDKILGGL